MNLTTRERLIQAATRLFADGGYRGASVRDICNLAGANPGAISYHFGGKRQLYRAVLRRAASDLADISKKDDSETDDHPTPTMTEILRDVFASIEGNDTATRLVLRDLADGGAVAVESMTPPLRQAFRDFTINRGHGDGHSSASEAKRIFLEMAAPVFLLSAGWPIVAQVLELSAERRGPLFDELIARVLNSEGEVDSG